MARAFPSASRPLKFDTLTANRLIGNIPESEAVDWALSSLKTEERKWERVAWDGIDDEKGNSHDLVVAPVLLQLLLRLFADDVFENDLKWIVIVEGHLPLLSFSSEIRLHSSPTRTTTQSCNSGQSRTEGRNDFADMKDLVRERGVTGEESWPRIS